MLVTGLMSLTMCTHMHAPNIIKYKILKYSHISVVKVNEISEKQMDEFAKYLFSLSLPYLLFLVFLLASPLP